METLVKYLEKQKDLARSREGNGHYCIISSGRGGILQGMEREMEITL